MPKVELELSYEELEPLVVGHLKEQYEILIKSAPLGFDEEELNLSEAYKLVLKNHMGEKAFNKYTHDLAKKKGNSKRLTDAYIGF